MDFPVILAMAGAGTVLFGAYHFSRRKLRTKKCTYCCNEMDKDQSTCPHCHSATRPANGIGPPAAQE